MGADVIGERRQIAVLVRGFAANESLVASLLGVQPRQLQGPSTDAEGQAVVTVDLPEALPRGAYAVEVSQPASGLRVVVPFVHAYTDEHLGRPAPPWSGPSLVERVRELAVRDQKDDPDSGPD